MSETWKSVDVDTPVSEWIIELSSAQELREYLVASMTASGSPLAGWSRHFRSACRWFALLLAQGFDRAPFFLVHDLGVLLLEGRAFEFRLLSDEAEQTPQSEQVRHRQVLYQNRVLNAVMSIPVFDRCVDALDQKGHPDDVVATILERLLEPVRNAPLPTLSTPSHLIRQAGLPGARSPEAAEAELDQYLADASWSRVRGGPGYFFHILDPVCRAYESTDCRQLLGPEDVFVVRHFETLGSRVQRLTARQIASVEESLGAAPHPPGDWPRETPQVTVDLDDAGYFPQGGLDQLANRGSIENLVRSELVYLEPEQTPDIFTLRFAENELLYYTRDEGQLMRQARVIKVFLDLSGTHHILYPGQTVRVSSMLQAFVNKITSDLFHLFESDAVTVHLCATGPERRSASSFWRIRFADHLGRGEVLVEEQVELPDMSGIPSPLVVPGKLTSTIYIGAREALPDDARLQHFRTGLQLFWVTTRVDGETDLGDPDPAQWAFDFNMAAEDAVEQLAALRTALVWRLF